MHIIQKNPYRIVGLLVGATAREQERQVKRLKQFIQAEQETDADFSFQTLGHFERTIEKVEDAASKLNLNSDKMSAALFWFYNGNSITDEVAFDAIKRGDFIQAINIWTKLIINENSDVIPRLYYDISSRNASAYFNLATLLLSGILESNHIRFTQSKGVSTFVKFLREGIKLKLNFLESNFTKELRELATDETYKISKKELQLLFLNQIQSELNNSDVISLNELYDIIIKQEFSAKDDYINGFIRKPIELIEKKIDESKTKRKDNNANGLDIGETLYKQTFENLKQLEAIFGESNIKYASIADKVANEMLQCSIEYFNFCQENESDSDYFEQTWNLAKSAESIAIGKLTKDRIIDNLNTLEEMKDSEFSKAIDVLKSIKDAYDENKAKIRTQVLSMHLGPNQTINWDKVNKRIEESLDWDKVVDLILKVIPQTSIEKIKNINDAAKTKEYKILANFVISKLSYFRTNKVKYICYWETESTFSIIKFTIKSLPLWIKWTLSILIFILLIALIWGEKGLENLFAIAVIIGFIFLFSWRRT